ncbi:GNAT family N-acetyltransferase [Microvirga sp. W0021]|uniref:GNAT family N-acetyltransferase n=1 Tax=Hohaiivirga grylli TaxID=3133970 RepID=A0ABV0BMG5_9HYPH
MTLSNKNISIRLAHRDDLEALVHLFAEDEFNQSDRWTEESAPAYYAAFEKVQVSENSNLYSVLIDGEIVGTFTLVFIPVIFGGGAHRVVLEGVHVSQHHRSAGIGRIILEFTEKHAKEQGAKSVALTSKKVRIRAHGFYEKNGYLKSHEGFRKQL